jgi:hypothetical protein
MGKGNPNWLPGGGGGNPGGRPPGSKNVTFAYQRSMLEAAPGLIDIVIKKALAGDKEMLKLCIDKIVPRVKGYAIDLGIDKDKKKDLEYLLSYNYDLINKVANGETIGEDVKALSDLISNQVTLIEKVKLEKQLDAISAELEKNRKNETNQ